VHEIFHFVWVRLANATRASFAALLTEELRGRARGELGESAAVRKELDRDSRDYVCESFCDTAAWLYSSRGQSPKVTLAKRWRTRRRLWFEEVFVGPIHC